VLGVNWARLPLILDSLLAQRITKSYSLLHEYWNFEERKRLGEGRDLFGFGQLVSVVPMPGISRW